MNEEEEARILAEKVMGWFKDWSLPSHWCSRQTNSLGQNYIRAEVSFLDWHPRTDIAQAVMLAEAVNDCLHLKQHGADGTWAAMFCGLMTEWCNASPLDNTPAAAICEAAIKTVEPDTGHKIPVSD